MNNVDINKLYDVIVIGGGPAGLTAALYLARARYRVIVLEKANYGGQITITEEVVNYPGVEKTSGIHLTETMRKQAQSFGAEFLLTEVHELSLTGDIKTVHTNRGDFQCFGILLATGAHPRTIGFVGEEEFRGRGVAYCATCDGEFFTGKEVFVIGGGFAAAEESVFLTKYAKHVTLLIREPDFTCAKATADATRANPNITIFTNVEVESVSGDSALRKIRYKNTKTGEITDYEAAPNDTFGVFVFAGYEPATKLIQHHATLTPQGYVVTDKNQQTSVPGLYAAGDVCDKPLRQVVTAVGDGALAATELEKYAATLQAKTGLRPVVSIPEKKPTIDTIDKTPQSSDGHSFFSEDIQSQLLTVFQKMSQPMQLALYLDQRAVSTELEHYMTEMTKLSNGKLTLTIIDRANIGEGYPCVKICQQDGTETGLAFHGVPGGHEFTSFVLGLYNAAGPGQSIDSADETAIRAINKPIHIKVLVSLACTMCPELVIAAQRLASLNPLISAEVYDLNHFNELKEQYNVMSVPCLVINDNQITFGKKNLRQLLDILPQ